MTITAPVLNEQQQAVAYNVTDNILLLAGAGTGKTGTLAARVAHLLDSGVSPGEIICLTFTNRACREMTQRVESTAGFPAREVVIRTVHSFCAWLLRQAPDLFDFGRDFTVCDEVDALETIRTVVLEVTGKEIEDRPAGIIQKFIALVKERQLADPLMDCRHAAAELFTHNRAAVEKVCVTHSYDFDPKFFRFLGKYGASITELYNHKLRESNVLDFADLLLYACRAMAIPEMRRLWDSRYRYVHVDEAQDMSLTEYNFLTLFCRRAKLMLCGDFNQTIYEWRGSTPTALIEAFQKSYSPLVFRFTVNYRCGGQLIDLASNYLYHAFSQGKGSALDPASSRCGDVLIEEFETAKQEVDWIYRQIEGLELEDLSRCAILTRNNNACKSVCDLLKLRRLDSGKLRFMLADELRLFRRPEVKDLLCCLRLFLDPFDGESLRRVLTRSATGIGPATLRTLVQECPDVRLTDFTDSRTARTGDFFAPLLDALDNGRVVVFDVESTGTDVYMDDIIQMAAVRLSPDGTVAQRFERFLIPSRPVGLSQQVHGFSDVYLAEHGMMPEQALEAFLDFAGDCVIVGHNVHFDMTITAENLKRRGVSRTFDNIWYDTLDLARRFLPKLENHKLSTVSAFLKTHTPSHDAMDDILATAGVLVKLAADYLTPRTEQRRICYKKHLPRFAPVTEKLKLLRGVPPGTAAALLDRIQDLFVSDGAKPVEQANRLLLRDFAEDFGDPDLPLPRQISALLELTALTAGELDRMGKSQNKVPVITVHQSKGCEFDYVFMPMLQEGVFPSYQALSSNNDAEERRVFYVSLTRAKKRLYLSWSHRNEKGRSFRPSRYLKMLGPNTSQNISKGASHGGI